MTQDVYPYVAASTLLSQLVPPWAHEGGCRSSSPGSGPVAVRQRIAAEDREGPAGLVELRGGGRRLGGYPFRGGGRAGAAGHRGPTVAEAARARASSRWTWCSTPWSPMRASTTIMMLLMEQPDIDSRPPPNVIHRVGPAGGHQPGGSGPPPCVWLVRAGPRDVTRGRVSDLAAVVHGRMTGHRRACWA